MNAERITILEENADDWFEGELSHEDVRQLLTAARDLLACQEREKKLREAIKPLAEKIDGVPVFGTMVCDTINKALSQTGEGNSAARKGTE